MLDDLVGSEDPYAPPITTDPAEIEAEIHNRMREAFPNWQPLPLAVMTHLIGVFSQVSAETRAAFVAQLRTLVLNLLGAMFAVPRRLGTPARSTITITAIDTLGHELDERTTVHVGDVECQTVGPLTIATGQSSGTIGIAAVEIGTAPNGADAAVEIDALDWIDAVVLDDPLDAGEDPEDDLAFSARLADEMQLLTKTPILPENWSTVARRHPIVAHVWVLDGYNPVDRTFGNERETTIVVADRLGVAPDDATLRALQAIFEALREVNWTAHVVGPSGVPLDVRIRFTVHPRFDRATVERNVAQHIEQVLRSVNWIQPPYGRDPSWVPTRRVHENELIAQADRVTGVDIVTDVTIGDGRAAFVDLDELELPTPGTITAEAEE